MAPVLLRKDNGVRRPKTLHTGEKSGEHRVVREDLTRLLAHDLKTPLASISMNLDFAVAALGDTGSEGVMPALDDCRQANARAIRIVSDMADAVRLATGDYCPTLVEMRPGRAVEVAARAAACHAEARGVHIAYSTDDTLALGDVDLLARVLDRVLERAVRQARTGTRVEIEQAGLTVSIRADTSAELEVAAPTLALYFAEAAMAAVGGAVWAESVSADILVYRVVLPS
jgi:K+-sensing histidine kinase KdpD